MTDYYSQDAGSALTAEIGLMKATEQLSAMEMMAVNLDQASGCTPIHCRGRHAPYLATIFQRLQSWAVTWLWWNGWAWIRRALVTNAGKS
ncbi:MAG: ABC transporter permease [Thiotrichaceae bacterium]